MRETTDPSEQIPGIEAITPEDVVMGLYDGFRAFQSEQPEFRFILSPSFRKEPGFFDASRYPSKRASFDDQVRQIIALIKKHPELSDVLNEVDTVGNERGFYRKAHFQEMRVGIRKLQAYGFRTRSHHGETWNTLRQGIQAVDNAMNIWYVDAIEHGLSLGINPNFYFHATHAYAILRHAGVDVDTHAHPFEYLLGGLPRFRAGEPAHGATDLTAEDDVLGDGEMAEQGEVLVDDLNPGTDGISGLERVTRHAVDDNLAGTRCVHPSENLDESGLSRSVLADKAAHLTLADRQRHVFERVNTGEFFADVSQRHQRFRHGKLLC